MTTRHHTKKIAIKAISITLMVFFLAYAFTKAEALPADSKEPQRYGWKGTIGDKIPVSIWIEVQNDLVVGEIIYTAMKAQTPIRLLGTVSEHNLYISEMAPDGEITGTIWACIHNDILQGEWISPIKIREKGSRFDFSESKRLPLRLAKAPTPLMPYTWDVAPTAIEGEYAYSYGNNAASGGLNIGKTKDGSYTASIASTIGAPSFHMAMFPLTESDEQNWLTGGQDAQKKREELAQELLHNNRLVMEEDDACAIEIFLFSDFAFVQYLENKTCPHYFGRGASIEGIFLKIKAQKGDGNRWTQ